MALSKQNILKTAIITVLCAALFFVPFNGLENSARNVMIVFFWAILMWIFRPLPEYLVSILTAAIMALFLGMGDKVISGFSNAGWFLNLWAAFMGGVLVVTGLGERMAYLILIKLGKTELSASYATNIASTILASCMPSNTALGALVCNIADNICNSLGYKPGEERGGASLMVSNLLTNTTNTWLFYTGTGCNAIGMALIIEATGRGITYLGWLKATWLPALVILALIPLICHSLFGPKKADRKPVDLEFARKRLAEMGPMKAVEKRGLIIMGITILIWCTESLHGLSTNYVAFLMIFALLCPGIGCCKFEDIKNNIPWAALIWLAFAMSFATCVNSVGGFQWIVDTVFGDVFVGMSFTSVMMIWLPIVVLSHIIFAGMNAMVAIMVPVSLTMANAMGFDPYVTGLLTVMAVSVNANFLPFNSAPNMLFYGTGRFTVKQEFIGAVIVAAMVIVGMLFCIKVFWPLMGII